jgi:hypothetical protein
LGAALRSRIKAIDGSALGSKLISEHPNKHPDVNRESKAMYLIVVSSERGSPEVQERSVSRC